jgi:hypothetical protein
VKLTIIHNNLIGGMEWNGMENSRITIQENFPNESSVLLLASRS